jgi:hypothetical protein
MLDYVIVTSICERIRHMSGHSLLAWAAKADDVYREPAELKGSRRLPIEYQDKHLLQVHVYTLQRYVSLHSSPLDQSQSLLTHFARQRRGFSESTDW